MIKFLWGHFKNYKKLLVIVAFCSILTAAVNLLEPYLTAKFIDEILISKDVSIFYNFILALAGINIITIAANWIATVISSKVRIKINNKVIKDTMKHIYKVRGDFIFKTDMIYLSKRLDQDTIDLIHFAMDSLIDTCINFALLCMAFFLLCTINFKWGAVFLLVATFHGVAYRALQKILFNLSIAVRETDSKYFTYLSDIFLYVYSIKLHSLYEEWLEKFHAAFEKNFIAVMRQVKIRFWFTTSSFNANSIFKVLIFLLGGLDVLAGKLTIGNFVALNGYYLLAMQGVAYFMSIGQSYQNALSAYSRIMEIKKLPIEIEGTKILTRVNSIEIKNVVFNFGERKIFKNLNKKFLRGKIYCIIGKNGTGKTTLINLICGMLKPETGEIYFNGLKITEINMIHARKHLIAVVEQKDFLKNDNLSGGERRTFSIATAFDKFAQILIMDEPDNNLDSTKIDRLKEKIADGKEERITIIISHDDRIKSIADEILNLNQNF